MGNNQSNGSNRQRLIDSQAMNSNDFDVILPTHLG